MILISILKPFQIERRINEKVISCANGEGHKKIKSEKEVQPRCVNSHVSKPSILYL